MRMEKIPPDDASGTGGGLTIALAGNPNVGKSTVFNALTGRNQHTGNWAGKTVTNAKGICVHKGNRITLMDLPGTYSLAAHSAEEEVARDFICFGGADAVIVVADAVCLERNLILVLQTLEITPRVVLCVNMMDEAEKKGIRIDLPLLSDRLGIPVVGVVARRGEGLAKLLDASVQAARGSPRGFVTPYPAAIEQAIRTVSQVREGSESSLNPRFAALRLLEGDAHVWDALCKCEESEGDAGSREETVIGARRELGESMGEQQWKDAVTESLVKEAEALASAAVRCESSPGRDAAIDRILTGRRFGIPVMVGLLALILWITVWGANIPSSVLSSFLFGVGDRLKLLFTGLGAPSWLTGVAVDGAYGTLAWVVSVMLPPMAIFFPLFTLLEDVGYLPRVAFNLDRSFHRVSACGKQALTMCMGLGCNAAGVVGCRIIDSPRERLLAIITNSFMPCNGRFPTLIALITVFFASSLPVGSLLSALGLTGVILLGVFATFGVSKLLSKTLLKGQPSSFTLELPPYRMPQVGKVLVRSVFDRTLFVLGRAAAMAAPAGALIWGLQNCTVGGVSILSHLASFLDPFARLMGLDGVILMAFILGFPANEIVMPIVIMSYLSKGSLTQLTELSELSTLLQQNGWTWLTALCVILFSLFHWPCSTTCLTIKAETGSLRWTAVSMLVPTLVGVACCMALAGLVRITGLV